MASMTRLRRRMRIWTAYAAQTSWSHSQPAWSQKPISGGHWRAWVRYTAEKERREDLAARRWWPT